MWYKRERKNKMAVFSTLVNRRRVRRGRLARVDGVLERGFEQRVMVSKSVVFVMKDQILEGFVDDVRSGEAKPSVLVQNHAVAYLSICPATDYHSYCIVIVLLPLYR